VYYVFSAHPLWFDHPKSIRWRVQIMEFLLLFCSLRSTYFLQIFNKNRSRCIHDVISVILFALLFERKRTSFCCLSIPHRRQLIYSGNSEQIVNVLIYTCAVTPPITVTHILFATLAPLFNQSITCISLPLNLSMNECALRK
jgi:hypothetical protein